MIIDDTSPQNFLEVISETFDATVGSVSGNKEVPVRTMMMDRLEIMDDFVGMEWGVIEHCILEV